MQYRDDFEVWDDEIIMDEPEHLPALLPISQIRIISIYIII
jgi:hypothetical protein